MVEPNITPQKPYFCVSYFHEQKGKLLLPRAMIARQVFTNTPSFLSHISYPCSAPISSLIFTSRNFAVNFSSSWQILVISNKSYLMCIELLTASTTRQMKRQNSLGETLKYESIFHTIPPARYLHSISSLASGETAEPQHQTLHLFFLCLYLFFD